MNYIVDNIKIIVYQFVLILYYSLIIIFSLRKNEEMMEERKMLNIIPKNELEQILIKEDIRIFNLYEIFFFWFFVLYICNKIIFFNN